jgi:hypothetical protein
VHRPLLKGGYFAGFLRTLYQLQMLFGVVLIAIIAVHGTDGEGYGRCLFEGTFFVVRCRQYYQHGCRAGF